jgi:tripartite-type tricarboxylate transporter receptor subunit TctC
MKTRAAITFSLALCLLGLLCPESGRTEDVANYPSRQIRIVVPFPAGGTADSLPRIIAEKLRQKWSQTIVIDNRSGAGGNIGAEAVATSAPDGYTLLASPPGPIAINQTLYAKLSYNPSELRPVALIGTAPNVLDVRPGFPAKNVKELIDYAKANPEKVTFASQGNGSTSHLTAILFEKLTGTKMVHVPYRGTTPALQDIMGGTVDVFFDNLGSSLSLHFGGELRILGVCSSERSASLPDVPTVRESGIPDFTSVTWFALMAPKGTPGAIIQKLNTTVTDILKDDDVKAKFEKLGVQVEIMDVNATAKFIAAERVRWGEIIRSAHVTID